MAHISTAVMLNQPITAKLNASGNITIDLGGMDFVQVILTQAEAAALNSKLTDILAAAEPQKVAA